MGLILLFQFLSQSFSFPWIQQKWSLKADLWLLLHLKQLTLSGDEQVPPSLCPFHLDGLCRGAQDNGEWMRLWGAASMRKASPAPLMKPLGHLQQLNRSSRRQKTPGDVAGLVRTGTRGCSTKWLRFPQN